MTLAGTYYADADADGWGNADGCIVRCPEPGFVTQAGDCDDLDETINPGAAEVCGDGIDDNCSGAADEGCCPCFAYDEIDSEHESWLATNWSYSQETCQDVLTATSDYVRIAWYGERNGSNAGWDASDFYSLDYDAYGQPYCYRHRHAYSYDATTGTFQQTVYVDETIWVTASEHNACQDVLLSWADDNGLVCTP